MIDIIAQAIGIVAMVFSISSFQCKKDKSLLLMLAIGCTLFSVNYIMLGSYAAAAFNIINVIRSLIRINPKLSNIYTLIFICLLYIGVTIPTYDNWWTLMLLTTQITSSIAIWYFDGGVLRIHQGVFASPVWLINNIFISRTIGGTLCEIFSLTSIVVSLIRYGKNGFEKVD